MRNLALIATLLAAASTAVAGDEHAKKPRRPKAPDVGAVLATNDPVQICRAAIDLLAAGEPVRASLLLPRCPDAETGGLALADAARKARITVRKLADAQGWSPVEVVVRARDAMVTIEPFAEIPIQPGALLLPSGTYRIVARTSAGARDYSLTVADGKRALVMLDPPEPPPPAKAGVIDFGKDEPMTPPVAGPPPKVKHGSLIPDRYRKGLCTGKKCPRSAAP